MIVVDDCSTDGTAEYVKSIIDERVRYFRNEKNSGQEVSRMNGFRHASGKYITFLDDDDYYTDYEFFEKAINIFTEHEADEVPIVMVYANAKLVNVQTGRSTMWNIGKPGSVKGIDFLLGHEGYGKPPSTFPTVFRSDILRRAGLEDKMIFDTMTYIEAALEGDAWFMADVIGVYRLHGQNTTLGGYRNKKNPEREARHYEIMRENMRRWRSVSEVLQDRVGRNKADRLYISTVAGLIGYYAIARPSLHDRMESWKCALQVSGFMPKLWITLPLYRLKAVVSASMRKITPLRALYRFIKYRLRGRPYPQD